jgi:transposase
MSQTASREDFTAVEDRLLVAFELGWEKWRLAFATGMGQKPWQVVIPARDVLALTKAIGRAKQRFGLPESSPVFSCYEAGREGFWLHRLLTQMGVINLVVDSSSIEVNRRARRAKTDRLDAAKLISMLLRYWAGERDLWSVVHVPTLLQEDGRHLQREIRTLKKEQTRLINRVKGLLAGQGVAVRIGRGGFRIRWMRCGSGTGRRCRRACVAVWRRRSPDTASSIANFWSSSVSGMLGSGRARTGRRKLPGV